MSCWCRCEHGTHVVLAGSRLRRAQRGLDGLTVNLRFGMIAWRPCNVCAHGMCHTALRIEGQKAKGVHIQVRHVQWYRSAVLLLAGAGVASCLPVYSPSSVPLMRAGGVSTCCVAV